MPNPRKRWRTNHVHFDERGLVDEGVDALSSGHFPGFVLLVDRPLTPRVLMLLAESSQAFDSLLGAHGSPEYGRLGCASTRLA